MRLDKFLKVSRIIKRRSVAKEASNENKIIVNGKIAKPSTILKVNDIIDIYYYKTTLKVKVLKLDELVKKADSENMYEIISVEKTDI